MPRDQPEQGIDCYRGKDFEKRKVLGPKTRVKIGDLASAQIKLVSPGGRSLPYVFCQRYSVSSEMWAVHGAYGTPIHLPSCVWCQWRSYKFSTAGASICNSYPQSPAQLNYLLPNITALQNVAISKKLSSL